MFQFDLQIRTVVHVNRSNLIKGGTNTQKNEFIFLTKSRVVTDKTNKTFCCRKTITETRDFFFYFFNCCVTKAVELLSCTVFLVGTTERHNAFYNATHKSLFCLH